MDQGIVRGTVPKDLRELVPREERRIGTETEETAVKADAEEATANLPGAREEVPDAAIPEKAMVIWYLHRSLRKHPKTAKGKETERTKIKRKILINLQETASNRTRAEKKSGSKLAKTVQKPIAPPPKQEEKKPEVKEITLPEKLTIRELAEAMKMQPSAIVKKTVYAGRYGNGESGDRF